MAKIIAKDKLVEEIKTMGFQPFEADGNYIGVSAEHADGAADYWGEFNNGYPWINPKLEKFAKDNGGYWEWQNPGAIIFYPN